MNLVVGVDWGRRCHAYVAQEAMSGDIVVEGNVVHEGPSLAEFCETLIEEADGGQVLVGIEKPRGEIVDILSTYGFDVYSWNPRQTDAWRSAASSSGAKDDRRDAEAIADAIRVRPEFFRKVEPEESQVAELREIQTSLQVMTREKVAQMNRIGAMLQSVFPSLWPSLNMDTQWTQRLLSKLVTAECPWKVRESTLSKLVRGARKVDAAKVKELLNADAAIQQTASGASARRLAKVHLKMFKAVVEAQEELQAQRDQLITAWLNNQEEADRRDATIILSMPGAGATLLTTLIVYAWESVRNRDREHLRRLGGLAPVTKQTGGRGRPRKAEVHQRQACNHSLREAFHHWARTSILRDEYAKKRQAALRARGHTRGRALRQLGDGLLRVLTAALKAGTTYDPDYGRAAA